MNILKIIGLVLLVILIGQTSAWSQKKVRSFTVDKVINASAEQVWAVVGDDYGAIAKSHPKIMNSSYINGTLEAGVGAERVCFFNENGSQFVKEKIVEYDPENFTFKNIVYQAGKFPVDPEYTFAIYKLIPIDSESSRFTFEMEFRTKPAFMGSIMQGKMRKLIEDYAIAIEHYTTTGEKVTKDNFKKIKKQYAD